MDKAAEFVASWAGPTIRSRWAQIVFWDREDLDKLHQRENSRKAQSNHSGVEFDLAWMEKMALKHALRPYWDSKIEDFIQKDRMNMFFSQVYPIWAAIVSSRIEADNRGTRDFDELQVLHDCDLRIFESGYRPDRLVPRTEKENQRQEQKERLMPKAREVYAD